jgi:hypothetical protein
MIDKTIYRKGEIEYEEDYKSTVCERSTRYNEGKTEWSLIDWPSIECLARVLMFGKSKYQRDNWKKGWRKQDLVDSLMRHTIAIASGEDFDSEHGLPHVAGVMFNAMALEYCRLNNKFIE